MDKSTKNISFKCHQISKVLLKKFTNDQGKLKVFYKNTQATKLDIHNNIGFIRVPSNLFEASEEKWGKIENKFNRILDSLKNETILNNPQNIKTIKSFMALHFIRSFAFHQLLSVNERKAYEKLLSEIEDKIVNEDGFRKYWIKDIILLIPSLLRTNLNKAADFIESCNLQIAKAPMHTKFILGDIPVVNFTMDGKVGLAEGVGLTSSDVVFLPLTPDYVASLTKQNGSKYFYLNSKTVRLLNNKTKKQSIHEYYALPI